LSATTATVNGKLILPDGSAPPAGSFVQLDLKNYGTAQPQVSGVVVYPQKVFNLSSSDGTWSGTLYRNDAISVNGTFPTYWAMTYFTPNGPAYAAKYLTVAQDVADLDTLTALNPSVTLVAPSQPLVGGQSASLTVSLPLSTWTLAHNFGTQAVVAQCYDSSWHQIIPDTATATDNNTFTATFVLPQTGFMVCFNVGNWTPSITNPNYVVQNPSSSQTIAGDYPFTFGGSINTKRLEGIRFADQFAGADVGAQINAAIADLPTRGGIVDARGFVGDYALTTPIQINKPVHLYLGGNFTYSGAAIAAGILQLNAGSSGSIVEAPYTAFSTDTYGDNGSALTGNVQALVVTPSASMPVVSVALNVHDVGFRNLTLIGNSNVTDGIQHGGSVRMIVEHCLFTRQINTSNFPTGWAVNGTQAVQDGSQVRNSVILGWGGGIKFNGGTSSQGTGDGVLLIEGNFIYDVSLGFISLTTTFDAKIRNNSTGFSFLNASTAGILLAGTTTTPTIDNNHFDGSNTLGNSGVIDIKITGTCVGGSITNNSINGNTNDAVAAHDPDHGIDIGASVSFLTIENNQIINYAAGGTNNQGTSICYRGNKWLAGHAGTGTEIIGGSQGFDLNQISVPLNARLNIASMFRSGGNTSFPDVVGDGTNPLVLAGKGDGSGEVKFGTTTKVTVVGGLVSNTEVLTAAAPTVSAGQVGFGSTTATSATAGTNGAVPAQVAGYLIINVAGTNFKVPYFPV
jgi:hypothetical protein